MSELGAAASSDVVALREALRKSMRARCDALDPSLVEEWGATIEAGALDLVEQRGFDRIFIYLSIPQEVPTFLLTRRLLSDGRIVAAPHLRRGSFDMQPRRLWDLNRDVVGGLWGIPIPKKSCSFVDPGEIQVALVPCTAVDSEGYRIGRGGGCYDRLLAAHPHISAAGVAFEMQRVDACHPQPWDVPLDALITEKQTHLFARPRRGSR